MGGWMGLWICVERIGGRGDVCVCMRCRWSAMVTWQMEVVCGGGVMFFLKGRCSMFGVLCGMDRLFMEYGDGIADVFGRMSEVERRLRVEEVCRLFVKHCDFGGGWVNGCGFLLEWSSGSVGAQVEMSTEYMMGDLLRLGGVDGDDDLRVEEVDFDRVGVDGFWDNWTGRSVYGWTSVWVVAVVLQCGGFSGWCFSREVCEHGCHGRGLKRVRFDLPDIAEEV